MEALLLVVVVLSKNVYVPSSSRQIGVGQVSRKSSVADKCHKCITVKCHREAADTYHGEVSDRCQIGHQASRQIGVSYFVYRRAHCSAV